MRPGWLLFTIGLVLLACWTSPAEASSNLTQRELKALRAALKKQHRAKEQRASSNKVKAQQSAGGEYVPEAGPWSSTSATEPTCEQLREMWRQSKRHSRAAEATNEIPQYNDPFARSVYARQTAAAAAGQAEPTLRPRPERRPVVYGRLHSSPSDLEGNSERPLRPFEVLRKLQQKTSSSSSDDNGDSGAVILYGEDDKPPFARAAARGSLQHLREMVREEGAGPVKGSFKHLREIVREEQQQQQQQQGRNRHQVCLCLSHLSVKEEEVDPTVLLCRLGALIQWGLDGSGRGSCGHVSERPQWREVLALLHHAGGCSVRGQQQLGGDIQQPDPAA